MKEKEKEKDCLSQSEIVGPMSHHVTQKEKHFVHTNTYISNYFFLKS